MKNKTKNEREKSTHCHTEKSTKSFESEATSSAKKAEFMEVIAIYSCIHGKCNRWDSTTMTGDVRLFKV